jgi:hypothetical protein
VPIYGCTTPFSRQSENKVGCFNRLLQNKVCHTWIPIRIAFFGTLNPVESKALRKAVWIFGPKQAT